MLDISNKKENILDTFLELQTYLALTCKSVSLLLNKKYNEKYTSHTVSSGLQHTYFYAPPPRKYCIKYACILQ